MKRAEYVAVVTKIFADALRERREPTGRSWPVWKPPFSRCQGFTQGYYLDRKGPDMFGIRREGTRTRRSCFTRRRNFIPGESTAPSPSFLLPRRRRTGRVRVQVRDADGHLAQGEGPVPEKARTKALTEEELKKQLAKTGGTVYRAEAVEA